MSNINKKYQPVGYQNEIQQDSEMKDKSNQVQNENQVKIGQIDIIKKQIEQNQDQKAKEKIINHQPDDQVKNQAGNVVIKENKEVIHERVKQEEQKVEKKKRINIFVIGGTGDGKSTLANVLHDGKNSNRFKSSDTVEGGETQEISSSEGKLLGLDNGMDIKMYDVPGLADPEMPTQQWLSQFMEKMINQPIDIVIFVIKSSDYRMTLAQILALAIIKTFFGPLEANNVYVCFTFCDTYDPKEELIIQKLQSFEKYGSLVVDRSKMFKFYGDSRGLKEVAELFKPADFKLIIQPDQLLNFKKQLDQVLHRFASDNPTDGNSFKYQLNMLDGQLLIKDETQVNKVDEEKEKQKNEKKEEAKNPEKLNSQAQNSKSRVNIFKSCFQRKKK